MKYKTHPALHISHFSVYLFPPLISGAYHYSKPVLVMRDLSPLQCLATLKSQILTLNNYLLYDGSWRFEINILSGLISL